MNPEKQRIAIAEACGWIRYHNGDSCQWHIRWHKGNSDVSFLYLPDYLKDLNAMHEAVATLKPKALQAFDTTLASICGGFLPAIHAPAAQRAEAFLKTIGKWEEE